MALTVRSPPTPELRCPELVDKGLTCAVDGHDEMLTVRGLPGEGHEITPTRRLGDVEAEVTSRMLDEPGPRRPLNTLHPLSEAEPERLVREKVIARRAARRRPTDAEGCGRG